MNILLKKEEKGIRDLFFFLPLKEFTNANSWLFETVLKLTVKIWFFSNFEGIIDTIYT